MIKVRDLLSQDSVISLTDIAMIREIKHDNQIDDVEITYKQGAYIYLDMDLELLIQQIGMEEEKKLYQ